MEKIMNSNETSTAKLDGTTTSSSTTKKQQQKPVVPVDAEEGLRNELRLTMLSLKRREPFELKYKKLLIGGIVTNRRPVLTKDKFYKRIGSNIRERVEQYVQQIQGKDPFDRITARQPLQEDNMRSALTLREHKKHEQKPLLDTTLAAAASMSSTYRMNHNPNNNNNMMIMTDAISRERYFAGVVLGLQTVPVSKPSIPVIRTPDSNTTTATRGGIGGTSTSLSGIGSSTGGGNANTTETQKNIKLDDKKRLREEEEQQEREKEENMKKKMKKLESPQQVLHKFYYPIFKRLWEMEFQHLNNTNPFRIVIDATTCTSLGAPDYMDVIEKPMNLTYIQTKVTKMEYETLGSFFTDVDLMLNNAIKYNTDVDNPYRLAAEEMKRYYQKLAKKVIQAIQQKDKMQQQQQGTKPVTTSSSR